MTTIQIKRRVNIAMIKNQLRRNSSALVTRSTNEDLKILNESPTRN
jgi:hypothetical protein